MPGRPFNDCGHPFLWWQDANGKSLQAGQAFFGTERMGSPRCGSVLQFGFSLGKSLYLLDLYFLTRAVGIMIGMISQKVMETEPTLNVLWNTPGMPACTVTHSFASVLLWSTNLPHNEEYSHPQEHTKIKSQMPKFKSNSMTIGKFLSSSFF